MKDKLSFVYGIGSKAFTKEYYFYDKNCFHPLQKQLQLSIPLITSITLKIMNRKNQESNQNLFSIYVGKEINLKNKNDLIIQKYDLNQEDLDKLQGEGYTRVCLLNFKKYDQILIGLKEQDRVVSDVFALKKNLLQIRQLQN